MKGANRSKGGLTGGISILGCRVPTTCGAGGGKNQGGVKGAKGSKKGAKGANREQRGAKGVKRSEGDKQGVKGSKGSKGISMLGFRVPTTCGRKNFDDHI